MQTEAPPQIALGKEQRLKDLIRGYGSIAVAYSGGVDSAYLADVANEVLGSDASILLADSPSIPRVEVTEATTLAKTRGWNFQVIFTDEFDNEAYLQNDGTRCYHCRSSLFQTMSRYAQTHGVKVMAYGEIVDDLQDTTRLGAVAAKQYRVVSPLAEAGLTKDEIRALSVQRELPTADKPSFACLSSRFPVGMRVNRDDVQKVEATEEALRRLGFRQYRARHHGDLCRIEVELHDIEKLMDPAIRDQIVAAATKAGYRFVTMDLAGYRTGSTAGHSLPH